MSALSLQDRVLQIRRAHASAKPTAANPAWRNAHHDLGVVLQYVDELEQQVERLDEAQQVTDPDLGRIAAAAAYHSLSGRHKAALIEIAELRERLERGGMP